MAPAECKVLALLSLVAALLLLAHHGSSRLRGPGADLLLAALDLLQGVDVVALATRRNMVLLCHAILLLVLRDAGLLGTSPRRRRRPGAATTNDTLVACCSPQRSAVVWRPRNRAVAATKNAAVAEVGRLKRQRRGTGLAAAVEDPCAAPSWAEPEQGTQHESTKEIVLVEEQRKGTYIDEQHLPVPGELDQPAAVHCKTMIPFPLEFGHAVVADDDETSRADESGEEEEEDLDEMNRKFEAFIADTKKKMQLEEALQPLHVSGGNRGLLA